MKIKLFNRDHANMWLEKNKEVEPNIFEWKLKVDNAHKYCLEYLRVIGELGENHKVKNIEAVDPSGGPFISLGDEFEDKYKIIKILDCTTFLISERNNDN